MATATSFRARRFGRGQRGGQAGRALADDDDVFGFAVHGAPPSDVIAGLDPAIQLIAKKMDARVKPGHDGVGCGRSVNQFGGHGPA